MAQERHPDIRVEADVDDTILQGPANKVSSALEDVMCWAQQGGAQVAPEKRAADAQEDKVVAMKVAQSLGFAGENEAGVMAARRVEHVFETGFSCLC